MNKKNSKSIIPVELGNIASRSDIDVLDEKVGKCYSLERYEEFQDAVEKIVLKTISGETGGEKIKKHAETYFKTTIIYGIAVWIITTILAIAISLYFKK